MLFVFAVYLSLAFPICFCYIIKLPTLFNKEKLLQRCLSLRVAIALCIACMIPVPCHAVETMRVVVDHWAPWTVAPEGPHGQVTTGISVNVINELCTRMNVSYELITRPWVRALSDIEAGTADIVLPLTRSSEREKYLFFTVPTHIDRIFLAYSLKHNPHFDWDDYEDLKGYVVGMTRGYFYGEEWENAVRQHGLLVQRNVSDIISLKMVFAGRIDIVPVAYSTTKYALRHLDDDHLIRFHDKLIRSTKFYIGISKRSPFAARIDEINAILEDMQADGTMKALVGEYYQE